LFHQHWLSIEIIRRLVLNNTKVPVFKLGNLKGDATSVCCINKNYFCCEHSKPLKHDQSNDDELRQKRWFTIYFPAAYGSNTIAEPSSFKENSKKT
jgi:hypothetical protein